MATRVEPWQGPNKSRRKACGECRRLKLRCEKIFPCESCQKRGCAAICPDGSFMKGTRSLKTSALKLHEKMAQMSARIHDLEEALAVIQASISAEPHPLLNHMIDDERSRSPIPIAAVNEPNPRPLNEPPDELIDALGSLAIRPFGESQFHGETAISEYLLQVNANQNITASQDSSSGLGLPPDLILLSVLFPFPPSIPRDPLSSDRFLYFMPNYTDALRLCDIYFNHFSWCSLPVSREDVDGMLVEIYVDGQLPATLQHLTLPRISLLLMVYALGALFDIEKDLCPVEAEEYHSLARAALCGEQIFNNTTVDCVQSMSLMIWYMRMCPGRRSTGYLWAFSGLLSKLVQAIGLHREPTAFKPAEALRRQITFWEYISGDVWQSFVYGRPSSMVFSQIDCNKPREVGGKLDGVGGLFYKWKYQFTNLVGDVLTQTTGATKTTYRGILELERKLREFPVPPELVLPDPQSPNTLRNVATTLTLQRYVIRLWQHTTIMYIHRRFLVQAIRTNAQNLAQSPYAPSVSAAYNSACVQIADLRQLYAAHPRLVSRMHPYWSHAFSASIILGALVARSPSCEFALSAADHLDQACEVFGDAAGHSLQPSNALELMSSLQRKARFARAQYENGQSTDDFVALGAQGHLEPTIKLRNGSPSSPLLEVGVAGNLPRCGLVSSTNKASPTPASPPQDIFTSSSCYTAHSQAAAQWMQEQAYFPPRNGSEERGTSSTPSTSSGQYELSLPMDQSEWPQGFMESMGVSM